jgi:hypothetical protein
VVATFLREFWLLIDVVILGSLGAASVVVDGYMTKKKWCFLVIFGYF